MHHGSDSPQKKNSPMEIRKATKRGNILIKNIITKRYEERPKRKLFKFNKKVDKNKVKDNETK